MIDLLDQADPGTAEKILRVSLESYQAEASLIGSSDFPPLSESVGHIEKSRNCFYGYSRQGEIRGIVELEETGDQWIIARLVVSPKYFRRGIARQLVEFVQKRVPTCTVTTAERNIPAISLYEKLGFVRSAASTVESSGLELISLQYPAGN